MEIKFSASSGGSWFFSEGDNGRHVLCRSSLERKVDLEGNDTFIARFSKRKLVESFEITKTGTLVGVYAELLWEVRNTLRKAYENGYRYVRIELEQ